MKHLVSYSGGVCSFWAAHRIVEAHGPANVTLLFADTKMEDEDLYRFNRDAEQALGVPITTIADGRNPWQVFHGERMIGNTRMDPCSKILKRELLWRWIEEQCEPGDTTVYLGLDWTEEHRLANVRQRKPAWTIRAPMAEEPVWDKTKMLTELEKLGIRQPRLYEMGFPHNNCTSGSEKVITDKGTFTLKQLTEMPVKPKVLGTRSRWLKADFRCFGQQELLNLTIERNGKRKQIRATPDHVWLVQTHRDKPAIRICTSALTPGMKLKSLWSTPASERVISPVGIQHGICFGDGTTVRYKNRDVNPSFWLTLCGEKQELLRFFPGFHTRKAKRIGTTVTGIPSYFRKLPNIEEDDSYLYGFLQGWFAADGSANGRITSVNKAALEVGRNLANKVGLPTYAICETTSEGYTGQHTLYSLPFIYNQLPKDFFLRPKHAEGHCFHENRRSLRGWHVVRVEQTGCVEPVYCAIVPDGHVFTLEDNIATGNCGAFCVRAGQAHFALLLRRMPERYAWHEEQEQKLREYLRKDVAILRDRRNGKTRPMTLREFRERVQADQFDKDEWGGCGCGH